MNWQMDLNSFGFTPKCKKCGSLRVVKGGRYRKHVCWYRCKRCGCKAVFCQSDVYRMRKPSGMIAEAVRMYVSLGVSLRSVGKRLKVAHTTVARWVEKLAGKCFPKLQPQQSPTWHFDETYVRIRKKWWWLGAVLCGTTRLVLSWKLRRESQPEEIIKLLREAIDNAGFRPAEIVTDANMHYPWKIRKAFGYKYVTHRIERGLGHNQLIERHFREIKRRLKWFSSFRSLKSAEDFFKLFFFHHNYLKPHRGIGWLTPAQKAGLQATTMEGLLKPSITT